MPTQAHAFVAVAFVENLSLKEISAAFPEARGSAHELRLTRAEGGEVFLYPSGAKLLLRGLKQKAEPGAPDPLEKLTDREREVLGYTVEGYSSTEIGKKLFISPKTVDTYRARIMEKLNLHHRSELVRFALRNGLLKAD